MQTNTLDTAFSRKPVADADKCEEELLVPIDLSQCFEEMRGRAVKIINTVAKNSEFGRKMLEKVAENGYKLSMYAAGGWSGCVSEERKTMTLNCICSDEQLMQTLAHEARHVCQHDAGIESNTNHYIFKSAVMAGRAIEADAQAAACVVCYDLMQKGIDGPMTVFERERPSIVSGFMGACKDPKGPVTQEMLRGAFEGWYKDEKTVRIYEQSYLCGGLDDSWNPKNHPEKYYAKSISSKEIIETVCTDTSGKCYFAENTGLLDAPEKLAINEATMKKCQQAFGIRKRSYELDEDQSYKTLPLREELKAQQQVAAKENTDTKNPVVKSVATRLLSARRDR